MLTREASADTVMIASVSGFLNLTRLDDPAKQKLWLERRSDMNIEIIPKGEMPAKRVDSGRSLLIREILKAFATLPSDSRLKYTAESPEVARQIDNCLRYYYSEKRRSNSRIPYPSMRSACRRNMVFCWKEV